MNERQSPHHSQSKVVCRNFFGLWLLVHWKIRIAYRQWRSNWKGRKTKIPDEKPKVTLSIALGNGISCGWERKSTTWDLVQPDFGRVPERFLLSVRTRTKTENFVHWKPGPLFVFVVIPRMLSSWELNTRREIPYPRAPMYHSPYN